ncbi:hypothetical protein N658DRAFT_146380 [Parathielavia hyrcaniae]|uniref:Uncharacterized protein n=1 Tax=Parathielavia hyrcaniae TaxID=113614 RepID=A0AAN6T0Z8_9PEZI|nr:hypothetical protein N658DRAFT_146380 [Parathielavia hyrcaniae]
MFRGSCQGFQSGVGVGRGSPRPLQGSARYSEPFGFTEPHPVVKINLQESLSVVWDRDSSQLSVTLSVTGTTAWSGQPAHTYGIAQREQDYLSNVWACDQVLCRCEPSARSVQRSGTWHIHDVRIRGLRGQIHGSDPWPRYRSRNPVTLSLNGESPIVRCTS